MKYYFIPSGVMGWLPSKRKYQHFETDSEYVEYFREREE